MEGFCSISERCSGHGGDGASIDGDGCFSGSSGCCANAGTRFPGLCEEQGGLPEEAET